MDGNWGLYTSTVVGQWYPGPLRVQGYEPVTFPSERLRGFFDRLVALSVPITPHLNNMGGLDGTVTQLTLFGDLHSRVKFQWWSDPPPGWAPLVRVAKEMIEAFTGKPVED
jgi:hypothetical protein